MDLEFKELQLKNETEKGVFEGIACKYGNIDLANDRLLKVAGKGNNLKEVPILYQHNVNEVIGKGILTDGPEGIVLKATLFLEKDESNNIIFPLAYKAYELAKKGLMKLSIGYKVNKYEYKSEGNKTVRELKDIDVMEVSTVLFPCNEQAVITSVKSQEGGNKLEEKAMGFTEILNLRKSNELRWQLKDALDISIRQLIDDSEMKIKEKVAQLNKNVDDFATAYKETMTTILKASATGKKEVMAMLETKEEGAEIEFKAGAKISKTNKEKLRSTLKAIKEVLDEDEEEAEEGKESTLKTENKQESNEDDIIELKADEIKALEDLYNLTIKEEDK